MQPIQDPQADSEKQPKLNVSSVTAPTQGGAVPRLDLRILRALRGIIQAVDIYSRKLASQYKITAPQLVTLLCVAEHGPLATVEIAREVHLTKSTIVGILDWLEAKDLIQRKRNTEDRRLVMVSATEAGMALIESAPSPLQDVFVQALDELPELEQIAIALSLERTVELMEAKDIDSAPVLELGDMKKSTEPLD